MNKTLLTENSLSIYHNFIWVKNILLNMINEKCASLCLHIYDQMRALWKQRSCHDGMFGSFFHVCAICTQVICLKPGCKTWSPRSWFSVPVNEKYFLLIHSSPLFTVVLAAALEFHLPASHTLGYQSKKPATKTPEQNHKYYLSYSPWPLLLSPLFSGRSPCCNSAERPFN